MTSLFIAAWILVVSALLILALAAIMLIKIWRSFL